MNCRIIKKDEFVARMLAAQELRKERKRAAEINAADVIYGIKYDRQARYLRRELRKGH